MPSIWTVYGRLYDRLWDTPLVAEVGSAVVARAATHDLPVVDAGAGTGLIAEQLLRAGLVVEAHEPSPVMRRQCARRVAPCVVQPSRLDELGPRDEPCVVVASNVIHFTDDPRAAIAHLREVAGDGGSVVVVTPRPGATVGDVLEALRRRGVTRRHRAFFAAVHLFLALPAVVQRAPKRVAAAYESLPREATTVVGDCFVLAVIGGASNVVPGGEADDAASAGWRACQGVAGATAASPNTANTS